MNQWEITKYLIDAKKCVDSVSFIAKNSSDLANLNLRDITEDRLRKFYINLVIVIDNCYSSKNKNDIKDNEFYKLVRYQRNKNYAHKDHDYIKTDYDSLSSLANDMKNTLIGVFDLCRKQLPKIITLDFVSWDHDLYRFLNKIDKEKEDEITIAKYNIASFKPGFEMLKTFGVLQDTEDIKYIKPGESMCVPINVGLTAEEGLQNRQDFCIKSNALFGSNMWLTFNIEDKLNLKETKHG